MVGKTFKTGNSIAIFLPHETLEYLGIQESAVVSVELDRQRRQIAIVPVDVPMAIASVDKKFAHQVKKFIEQYRPALEALLK